MPSAPADAPGLEVRGVSKAFPNVQALRDISLDARPGEILALLGENGAGKSTLLKIINGDYQPDSGTLSLGGQEVKFANPFEAHRAGVRVVYQEPEIVPGVAVAENIYLGELPRRGPFIDFGGLEARVRADLARYGFTKVLPMDLMGDMLSSAQRQLIEILRALKSNVRVLALDEPASSLTDEEVDRLFALVRRLRDDGLAIIYVSHRIKEILRLAARVAILRDGQLVAVKPASGLSEAEIVKLMVGRDLSVVFQRRRAATDRVVLKAEHIPRLRVRTPSLDQEVGKLSGGNQQKVVLARWLAAKPKALILDEPTRGIDVGAKAEIYRLVDDLANQGLGVMFISSELPEILGLSDRIYVMQNGRIAGELPGPGATEEAVLGLAMAEHLSQSVETQKRLASEEQA